MDETSLLNKYNDLLDKYNDLQDEFLENTIVQSMNDMKNEYLKQKDIQAKLVEIIYSINESNKAVKIMIDTLMKQNMNKYVLKDRLEFINEIIMNSIQKKSDIYYLDLGY